MKSITFLAYCKFGKLDSGETEVEVDLTDEEYERVMALGTKTDIYYGGFYNCTELRDIYDKVYDAAIEQMTEEMRDYGDFDEDEEEEINDPEWQIDDMYACEVDFPREFEDMLIE